MPKKGQRQPWKCVFRYPGQNRDTTCAHDSDESAYRFARDVALRGATARIDYVDKQGTRTRVTTYTPERAVEEQRHEIVDRINSWEKRNRDNPKPGACVWQDVIYQLDELDEDATDELNQFGDKDVFVIYGGARIQWSETSQKWI